MSHVLKNPLRRRARAMAGMAGVLCLMLAAPIQADDPSDAAADQGRVAPAEQYGTDPGETRLPETAVDTDRLPNIVVDPQAPDDKPLPYYNIAPNTYMLYGNIAVLDENNRGWNGNAGFVVTSKGVVVIDSLGTPKLGRRLIATVRSVTDRPVTHLILTHNHPDHSYGAIAFRRNTDASIIGHEGTLEYLASPTFQSSVQYRRDLLGDDMKGFEGVRPDRLVGGERFTRYELNAGDHTFQIYNVGHHHSHGDLAVHQVNEDIVWISDLAFNQRLTYMADGDSKQAIEGQNWLLDKFGNARLMVPGHGSAQTPPFPMVKNTRRYMQRLRKEMGQAFENGLFLQQAVEQAEFPEWKDVRLYELNHRANANFVYREMEQELF